jgi:outer membrane biogenesis lipoprotein LolB
VDPSLEEILHGYDGHELPLSRFRLHCAGGGSMGTDAKVGHRPRSRSAGLSSGRAEW